MVWRCLKGFCRCLRQAFEIGFAAEHGKVCLGEMASFYIPARLAYGAEGSLEERIPPNADLVYKVEILDIESELELALWLIEWKKNGCLWEAK